MRSVKLWYSSVTKDIFHLTGSFMISLSVSIQKIRLDKRDFPIWSRSDPNITTRVPDLVCLSTCKYMYVRIRNYTFIANYCTLLRWGMIIIALLFTTRMENHHYLKYDTITDTLKLNATQRSLSFHQNWYRLTWLGVHNLMHCAALQNDTVHLIR